MVSSDLWSLLWNVIHWPIFGVKKYVHSSILTFPIALISSHVCCSTSGISIFHTWAIAFPRSGDTLAEILHTISSGLWQGVNWENYQQINKLSLIQSKVLASFIWHFQNPIHGIYFLGLLAAMRHSLFLTYWSNTSLAGLCSYLTLIMGLVARRGRQEEKLLPCEGKSSEMSFHMDQELAINGQ